MVSHDGICTIPCPLFLLSLAPSALAAKPAAADLVVYGGTASGVMTAYSAARQGLHVILLEPTQHLGGMVTGGLSATDYAYFPIIGGYTRQFYKGSSHHVWQGVPPHRLISEPKVGEAIFNRWLKADNVDVRLGERLKEHGGVEMKGKQVACLHHGRRQAMGRQIFADCSYEGDAMAKPMSATWSAARVRRRTRKASPVSVRRLPSTSFYGRSAPTTTPTSCCPTSTLDHSPPVAVLTRSAGL